MSDKLTRRAMLQGTSLAAGATLATGLSGQTQTAAAADKPEREPFGYCLNTSTIRGQGLTLPEEIDVAAKAGYTGLEPWLREIEAYLQSGGTLAELRKRLDDNGLSVQSAIGFAKWIVDDPADRKAGLEQAKHDMDLIRQLGGTRIAAPPVGAVDQTDMDLNQAALRYAELLALGQQMGVTPELELWGFSQTLHRLGELMYVAVESGRPDACVLLDVYHIFKGGSDFAGIKLINGRSIAIFHFNDYPAEPARAEMTDAHRVYPGDGVAPIGEILRDIYTAGYRGYLSLELFNREYWEQDALTVARTGLEKMRSQVRKAFSL